MKIALAPTRPSEHRVPLTPSVAGKLIKLGHEVRVPAGCGLGAGFEDEAYRGAGANVQEEDPAAWIEDAELLLTIEPPDPALAENLPEGALVAGMLAPFENRPLVEKLAGRGITAFAMELIPRISRAQSMDVLSSQANIAGYQAVILAAHHAAKMFPMMMTAAGTIAPARVFVIGAGVAGLQAIATARRLGAVVEAFDVRPEVEEQVKSLGARFVQIEVASGGAEGGYAGEQSEDQQRKQAELMARHVTGADAVIATAAIFGKAPPMLIPADVVGRMRRRAVLVDMAASDTHGRGNCELTRPGEVFETERGVSLVGHTNLPSLLPIHASEVFAANMHAFIAEITGESAEPAIDPEDAIQGGAMITRQGAIVNDRLRELWGPGDPGAPAEPETASEPENSSEES